MGVMRCDRSGCENILCDRCDGNYYICNKCFEELVDLGPATNLDDFMSSSKRESRNREASYNYWNTIFPDKRSRDEYS